MARIKEYDIDPDNVDAEAIAVTQTATGSGSLTLTATGGLTLDYGRRIGITNTGNNTGVSFVVTGTDNEGYDLTETVAGVSDAVSTSTEFFKTVTSITNSAAITGGITAGTVDEVISSTIPLNYRSDLGASVALDVTGTASLIFEQTFDDVQRPGQAARSAYQNSTWYPLATAGAADVVRVCTPGATAFRMRFASYTNTAEIQFNISQPGGNW